MRKKRGQALNIKLLVIACLFSKTYKILESIRSKRLVEIYKI